MCGIVDANIVHEVFSSNRPEAGGKFFEWINTGMGQLVIGGKLREELFRNNDFMNWAIQAQLSGRLRSVSDDEVAKRTKELEDSKACISDDQHIIALAQVSSARLLYSNDRNLHKDFKKKALVDGPRGKVYTTYFSKEFRPPRRKALASKDLCKVR